MNHDQLFLDHLPYIDKVAARLCRRYFLRKEEEEDFLSHVKLKLWEDDHAVLRKFQGRCNFKTFLNTVIANLLKDYQNSQLGESGALAPRHCGEGPWPFSSTGC